MPVGEHDAGSFQRTGALCDDPGPIGQRDEHRADDAPPDLAPTPARHFAVDRLQKPRKPHPGQTFRPAVAALKHHRQRGAPAVRFERFARAAQHRRPGAFQQVAQLLHVRGGLGDQPFPPSAQVPQSRPVFLCPFRHVAAQVTDQPGDQHGILVVGLVPGVVLALACPADQQRLHTPPASSTPPRVDQERATGARSARIPP